MQSINMAVLLDKKFLGVLSVALTFVAYVPYFYSLFRRRTKPHLFSWIIWTTMNFTAFWAQYTRQGGPGSWATGITATLSLGIIGFAARQGGKDITRSDWASFAGAFLAIFLWYLTDDPLWSVILISIIDTVACYPTLRKSYNKPWGESALSYGLCGFRAFIAIAALETYTLVTVLYPIAWVFSNGLLTFMLLWRRSVVTKRAAVVENPSH